MHIINILFDNGTITREGFLRVIAFLIALLIAIMLHEIAHGLSAYAFGDNTAKLDGRLTLNPIKHFDLIGLLMMLVVGFGWAKPVRINVNNFSNKRVGMIVVSLAGVITNILLAFVFALFYCLLVYTEGGLSFAINSHYIHYLLKYICAFIISFNISFALFNLLPLFPLDGYRLLSCFVPQDNKAMFFLRRYSFYILLGLLLFNYIPIPIINAYSPLNLYIGRLGGIIENAFISLWRLVV